MKNTKTLTILFLLLFTENTFSQKETKPITVEQKILPKDYSIAIESLQVNVSKLKENIQINKDIISDAKTKIAEVKILEEENHYDWLHEKWKLWGIISVFFGSILFLFGWKKYLQIEVEKKVVAEVSKVVDKEVGYLSKEFNEFRKHNKIRTETKKLILNAENTAFPESFVKVMELFKIDCTNETNRIDIMNFVDVLNEDNIAKIQAVDLLIIENQVTDNKWELNLIEADLIELCNKIGGKTAIMFYGGGLFPIEKINDKNKKLISYTNAPAQLYGNMMNLLKFKDEIEKPA